MSQLKEFYCLAAMDLKRGIGQNGKLPWPHLEQDYNYYTTAQHRTNDPDKVNMVIYGRKTWEAVDQNEASSKKINVVVSKTLREPPKFVNYVVQDLDAALKLAGELPNIETVWVCGGQVLYETGVKHLQCKRVYCTQIYDEFPSDTFFPVFEHDYQQVELPEVDGTMKEDNGIKYQFKVFKRLD